MVHMGAGASGPQHVAAATLRGVISQALSHMGKGEDKMETASLRKMTFDASKAF